jgi:hypothetical protein
MECNEFADVNLHFTIRNCSLEQKPILIDSVNKTDGRNAEIIPQKRF